MSWTHATQEEYNKKNNKSLFRLYYYRFLSCLQLTYVVLLLNRTPIFEWYRPHGRACTQDMCYDEFGLCVQNLLTVLDSIVKRN